MLAEDGSLDRPRLGSIVFADAEKLAVLNSIVHPLVGARSRELEEAAAEDSVVVHDVPLLAENGLAPLYDLVIVVDASPETQLDRLVRLRGMTEEDARARMAAQATRDKRLEIADVVIDNDVPLEALQRRVRDVWADLVRAGPGGLGIVGPSGALIPCSEGRTLPCPRPADSPDVLRRRMSSTSVPPSSCWPRGIRGVR